MADAFENLDNDQVTDPIDYISTNVEKDFVLRNTNCDEVTKKIQSLDEKKSCGYDLISNKVLKSSCDVIAPFLTSLINKCF